MKAQLTPIERMELFCKRSEELASLRFVRQGMSGHPRLTFPKDGGDIEYEEPGLDEEDLRSFLLLFRQFVSKKELIFVPAIMNECLRQSTSDHIKSEIIALHERWKTRMRVPENGWVFVINNRALTTEEVLDLWLNGHYSHSDVDKMERLSDDVDRLLSRMHFILTVPGLSEIIFQTAAIIRKGLEENLFGPAQESA